MSAVCAQPQVWTCEVPLKLWIPGVTEKLSAPPRDGTRDKVERVQ